MALDSHSRKCKSTVTSCIPSTEGESDYEQPPKKGRYQTKKPTRKQRLARLDRISEKYARKSLIEPNKNSVEQDKIQEKPTNSQIENFDALFDLCTNENIPPIENNAPSIEVQPVASVMEPAESILNAAILKMQIQMEELVRSNNLIRKQLCRLELKSFAGPSSNINVNSDELLDLQEALAQQGLPLKSKIEVDNFETKLRNQKEFRRKTISLLSALNGVSGDKIGSKVIQSIVDEIIEPTSQHLFSMTGKSGIGQPRKVAFENYSELIGVIFATCLQADKTYSLKLCTHDLTYKILKRGNAKRNR